MRNGPFIFLAGAAAAVSLMEVSARTQSDELVITADPRLWPTPERRSAPPQPPVPREPTAADLERIRVAAARRARKAAKQAKGFTKPNPHGGDDAQS